MLPYFLNMIDAVYNVPDTCLDRGELRNEGSLAKILLKCTSHLILHLLDSSKKLSQLFLSPLSWLCLASLELLL